MKHPAGFLLKDTDVGRRLSKEALPSTIVDELPYQGEILVGRSSARSDEDRVDGRQRRVVGWVQGRGHGALGRGE